jgi:hypothetical protein
MLRGINRTNVRIALEGDPWCKTQEWTRYPFMRSAHAIVHTCLRLESNALTDLTSPMVTRRGREEEESYMQTEPFSETQIHGRIHGKYVANLA